MGIESRSSHPGVLSEPPTRTPAEPASGRDVRAETHLRAGSVAGLRSMRAALRQCLEQGGCATEFITDAQLVLAEIATNAFVHDTAPLVEVEVTCWDDEARITTWHRGESVPPGFPVAPVPIVGPDVGLGGRGLAMVDKVVVSREVVNDGGCTSTVVRMRR